MTVRRKKRERERERKSGDGEQCDWEKYARNAVQAEEHFCSHSASSAARGGHVHKVAVSTLKALEFFNYPVILFQPILFGLR